MPLPLRHHLERQKTQQLIFILSVLIPVCAVFVAFMLYPMADGFYGSLTAWRAFRPGRAFIGLTNFENLFNDQAFLISLVNTFKYALFYLPGSVVLGLAAAVAIDASRRLRGLFRVTYFIPVVTSVIATSLIWNWLYQPNLGPINQILHLLGLPEQGFLRSVTQALPSVAVYALWKNLGYNMVLFSAGLSGISSSYFDAAKVDGANHWQVFRHITLPLLQPTMVFVVVTGVINTLQVFGPIYVMTGATVNDLPGGPANATMVVTLLQWLVAFKELRLGYGSAIAVVLFVIILAITLLQIRFLRQHWEY